MAELTRYPLVIRAEGAPPAPHGVTLVDLVLDEDDPASSVIDALRSNRIGRKDLQHHTAVFLAPENSHRLIRHSLVHYAVLYGVCGRLIDIHADQEIHHPRKLYGRATERVTRVTQPGSLMWAQVGGTAAEGIPTVHVDRPRQALISPQAAMIIRQAARLRMVPPVSAADAFALLVLVAALRQRDDEVRFPCLSTGAEPVPVIKDDPLQGIDLERIRREAATLQGSSRAGKQAPDLAAREPLSPLNGLIDEANAVDIRSLMERLGCSPDETGGWRCPRTHRQYPRYGRDLYLDFSGDNRVKCRQCDRERIGPVRLVVDTLTLTPDEAARFILRHDESDLTHAAVTAHVESKQQGGYRCAVHDPATGARLSAFVHLNEYAKAKVGPPELAAGDTIIALVTNTEREADGSIHLELSADTELLVERIVAGFIPELISGHVVIKKKARVAGATTKLAVAPTVRGVDAEGACIGDGGCRVTGAERVLNRSALIRGHDGGEKMQIILYSSKRATFLARAVKPATVVRSRIDSGTAVVAVTDTSGAIGSGGLNAQLAGMLTGLWVEIADANANLDAILRDLKANRPTAKGYRSRQRDQPPD